MFENTNFTLKEDEYWGEDGLIHCKKCGGARMIKLEDFTTRMACKCMEEAYNKKVEEEKKARELDKYRELQKTSLIGERYRFVTFENTDLDRNQLFVNAYKRCKKYCDAYYEAYTKGYGLYLYGSSGSGKTHLMMCIVNELLKKQIPCLFTNMFEIINAIRDNKAILDRISKIPFLFIDDIGTETVKRNGEDTWVQEKLYEIINKRYNDLKPTIFTSNYSLNELMKQKGIMEKTVQRIAEMATLQLEIKSESYRLK